MQELGQPLLAVLIAFNVIMQRIIIIIQTHTHAVDTHAHIHIHTYNMYIHVYVYICTHNYIYMHMERSIIHAYVGNNFVICEPLICRTHLVITLQ